MHSNSRYAKTVFDVCKKSDCISQVHNELAMIVYLYTKTPVFRLVMVTKRLSNQNKIDIMKHALKQFNPIIAELLSIMILNNQTNDLIDIISKFNRLVSMHSDIKTVDLITAGSLDDEVLNSLKEALRMNLKTTPKINTKTDPKIIGGIKLRIGNRIFDNSVNYQIKQLEKTLHNM